MYQRLKELVENGYLLHGSRKEFDVVKPFKKEKGHPTTGRIKAVYATDDPLMAIFCAIKSPRKLPEINGVRKNIAGWSYDQNGRIYIAVSPNFIKYDAFDKGWVYVVPKQGFRKLKKLPHEFYCYKEASPLQVIKVQPRDLFREVSLDIYPVEGVRWAGFHTEEEIKLMGYNI